LKGTVLRSRPHMAVRRMRIACWIPKATDTHSEYVILIAFPLQQRLNERVFYVTPTLCDVVVVVVVVLNVRVAFRKFTFLFSVNMF